MAKQIDFNGSPKPVLFVIGAALVVLVLSKGVYQVEPESQAVITRFGKFVKTADPGLHFKLPFVDVAEHVPTERQNKHEYGFSTRGATNPMQASDAPTQILEKTMVTGDLNSVELEWVVQFRIDDPVEFQFNVEDPQGALRDVSESVMREVVGDRTVDEVLTIGRREIEAEAEVRLREVVDLYEMGLNIQQVQLKNVNPPLEVRASFDGVNKAQQERERLINDARGEYNRTVPAARGQAQQRIQGAEGYATQRVNEAEGDVARFVAMLAEYEKAPEVTKRRIYLETMGQVMPAVKSKIVLDGDAGQVLPLLPLGGALQGAGR